MTKAPVDELIRATVARVQANGAALFTQLHEAVAASAPPELVADPALAAEIERSNVTILAAWLDANVQRPGAPVEPVLSAETLDIVRDVARRGLEDSTYNYFRVGQGIAVQHVMDAAFAESADPALLHEALGHMLASAADYVDRSVAALRAVIEEERRARADSGGRRRLEVATAIIDGDYTDSAAAGSRLGFELGRPLVGCILWTEPGAGAGVDGLESLARALAEACRARPPLLVPATAASVWAWLPTSHVDIAAMRAVVAAAPGARVAVGSPGIGASGFRSGHLDALHTQRVMHRLRAPCSLATHDEVRVLSLAGVNEPAAREFTATTLGPLAQAAPELRSTLRAVLSAGFDTAAVANELGLHRNSVLARIRRARALLPGGYEHRWIEVGLALELDRWLGQPGVVDDAAHP